MARYRVTVDVFLNADSEEDALNQVGSHIAMNGNFDYIPSEAALADPEEEP